MSVTLSLPLCKQEHLGFERSRDSPKVTQMEAGCTARSGGSRGFCPFYWTMLPLRFPKQAPAVLSFLCTEPRIPQPRLFMCSLAPSCVIRGFRSTGNLASPLQAQNVGGAGSEARTVFLSSETKGIWCPRHTLEPGSNLGQPQVRSVAFLGLHLTTYTMGITVVIVYPEMPLSLLPH